MKKTACQQKRWMTLQHPGVIPAPCRIVKGIESFSNILFFKLDPKILRRQIMIFGNKKANYHLCLLLFLDKSYII